jgi:hypothetical protein
MTSAAISAQGTTLKISTGTGGAKTITAGAIGNPTILTSAAHGLANGDVVAIAAIVGTLGTDATNGLNGKSFVISNITTNTFAIEVNSTGLAYTSGGTATPVTYTQIKELKTFSGFDGQAAEIDITNLDSTAKEFRLGLVDSGGFSFEINQLNSDPGQAALRTSKVAGTLKTYQLTLPNAEVATFTAYAKALPSAGGVDGVLTSSVALRISGSVTWA